MNGQGTVEVRMRPTLSVLWRRWLAVLTLAGCLLMVFVAAARAATPAAGWSIHSFALPSSFSTGDNAQCLSTFEIEGRPPLCDAYEVTARNAGSVAMDGSTIALADTLPAGTTLRKIQFFWTGLVEEGSGSPVNLASFPGFCTGGSTVRCQLSTGEFGLPAVAPDDTLRMIMYVTVNPGASGALQNVARVSGGGAPEASTTVQTPLDGTPGFGLVDLVSSITGPDGGPEVQAGAHPYEMTTRLDLANVFRLDAEGTFEATGVQDVRDVVVDLPLGFLGTALATPKCTLAQLSGGGVGGIGAKPGCPADTRLGNVLAAPWGTGLLGTGLYDMVPERGVAAEFGFVDFVKGSHVLRASVAPTPSGYVLRTTTSEISQVSLRDIEVVLYGNPAARDGSPSNPVPLFTNPADCSGEPLVTSVYMDSWQNPGRFNADGSPDLSDPAWASTSSQSPPVTGCNRLRFEPSLRVQPETTTADSPTGLDVIAHIPQSEEPGTLATPPLRDASVTLPAGLSVDPSAATGLTACSEAQIGLGNSSHPACPESSKIGTVEVRTPLVEGVLTGSIYLAAQNENPFHTLLAGYIVIDDPTTGTIIKVPGNLTPDPTTGQITGVFKESPQFPFSELRLHFSGGARGELATPTGCGAYTTTSDLMPWSAPDSGPDATPSDSFPIDTGCVTGFAPGFVAGSTNTQAGGYSPFTLQLSRSDGDQNLAGLSVTLPPGLLGKVAGIPLCPDAQANAGTCPAASQVGSVEVGAGVGPNPLFVTGKAYLTGPYNGGPYGLVVQVPAVAGPFDLGMVSVRQSLRIDPHTAQVTAVSDPFPTILDGIPLRVRRVDVTLDRPGFTFNPTNCTPMQITGSVSSTQGASSTIASRFQAGGCRELAFKPSFKVSTQASTSKKQGASLDVRVGYPSGAQANIGRVAVSLPKQLPARLTTIQQACLAATFNANPASCPVGSNIGVATASTPVLASPLSGPAYLVSHGGAAFPDLVLVLQGGGVTLDLVGSINIKHGVTSSAFDSVPDAPISSFELKLPEGPHSGLAAVVPAKAKGSMCGQSLTMPTTLTGQNGAQIKQTTKITVTGCTKTKKKTKAKKHPKKKGRKG
jgi:hypothetical protein